MIKLTVTMLIALMMIIMPGTAYGEGTNVLVAYFSCTGNTRSAAEQMAGALNATLYEIVPEIPYTSADLNYRDNSSRAT